MSRALKWQGRSFVLVALLVTATLLLFPNTKLDEPSTLTILAVLIILLGVPHGALDTIFFRKLYGVNSWWGWAIAGLSYIFLSSLVVGLWLLLPTAFLIGFLLLSIVHFSGDLGPGSRTISRILYGGAAIVLPTLNYSTELTRLFSLLAGAEAASVLAPFFAILAWPWLAALLVSSAYEYRRDHLTGLELLGVGLLTSLAPPLVGFTVFFCAMHSARHILRTIHYARPMSAGWLIGAAILPLLLFLALTAIAWTTLEAISFETRVIQIMFVGLAALTLPHMALVERVRFSAWGVKLGSVRRGPIL